MATYSEYLKEKGITDNRPKKTNYKDVYNDMVNDPFKYTSAFDNSITKYKSELSYYGYMADVQAFGLPSKYTQFTDVYADMRENKDKYIGALGGERAYKNTLQDVSELFNLEKTKANHAMSLMNNSVKWNGIVSVVPELANYYSYDLNNEDDAILQELGYAPSSFKYSQEDLAKLYQTGLKASDFADAKYIGNLYQYDMADEKDLLNKALGLMPKSFKYENSVEDQIRKNNRQLPKEAELYENNTAQFIEEYSEYSTKMQEYKNELYAWENLPKSSKLVTEKPVNPYTNEEDIPASIKALKGYRLAIEYENLGASEETDNFFNTPEKKSNIDTPFFAYDENMPIELEDFAPSDNLEELVARYEQKISSMTDSDLMRYADENGLRGDIIGNIFKTLVFPAIPMNEAKDRARGSIADEIYQDMYVEHLKETGEYEEIQADQKQLNIDIENALTSEYTPEGFALLTQNLDPAADLGLEGGTEKLQETAIKALYWSEYKGAYMGSSASTLMGGGIDTDIYAKKISSDPEIIDIKSKLDALGWKAKANGKAEDINPEVQELLNQATYRAIQLQKDTIEEHREYLKTLPSVITAIGSGAYTGANAVVNNAESLYKHILYSISPDNKESLGQQITEIANRSQAQQQLGSLNTALGKGASESTQFLYEASTAVTEMGIELAAAGVIGAGGAGAKAAGLGVDAATGAKAIWKTIGKKLVMNKNMTPFFVSSLGRNLLEGEQNGQDYAERWLQAIPAAYVESIIEQRFGVFSGHTPMSTLIKNGVKNVGKQSLANLGKTILDYSLGEAVEEVLQDYSNEFWRGAMYKDYETSYPTNEEIGKTALMAGSIGLLFAAFGLPSNISKVNTSMKAETSFNKAVAAYENGDIKTFNAEMQNLKGYMQTAIGDIYNSMDNGTFDNLMSAVYQAGGISNNLNYAQDAMKQSLKGKQAYEAGQITADQAAMLDAKANEAVNRIATNINSETAQPRTLYEQVASSQELTKMFVDNGFAAELIKQNNNQLLTNEQVRALREVYALAQDNPYINSKFGKKTNVETLQNNVDKKAESTSEIQAEIQSTIDSINKMVDYAYSVSVEKGQAKYKEIMENGLFDQVQTLRKTLDTNTRKLTESTKRLDGYKKQEQYRQMFKLGVGDWYTYMYLKEHGGLEQASAADTAQVAGEAGQSQGAESSTSQRGARSFRAIPMEGSIDSVVGDASLSEIAESISSEVDNKIAEVLTERDQKKSKLKDILKSTAVKFRLDFTDTGAAIYDLGKKVKDPFLYPSYNKAKQSVFAANYMIGEKQTDFNGNVVGPSLTEIFNPVYNMTKEQRKEFYTYAFHKHNIYRMQQGKPVFGESVTAEISADFVSEYESKNTEHIAILDQAVQYNQNLLQMAVDTHMITQEQADSLMDMYPFYVPTDRLIPETSGINVMGSKIGVSDTIRTATGSNLDLLPLDESMGRKTLRDVDAINKNLLGLRLLKVFAENPQEASKYISEVKVGKSTYEIDSETDGINDTPNTLQFYKDGEVVTMKVSDDMFFAFNEMTTTYENYNLVSKLAEGINSNFKKLITGYNPVFTARNGIRDIQAAGLNTKYPLLFVKNYPLAVKEIATNGPMLQMFKSMGAMGESFFDYKSGIKRPSTSTGAKIAKKVNPINLIESLNQTIEMLPRLTEFMATLEAEGMSYESKVQALYNSAEVTVNFGRSGRIARKLNRTWVPFLNPSIQGASRFVRRFTETRGAKQWTSLITRTVLLGIAPSIINSLLYADDDEYKDMNNRDKDRYYVFKLGDGNWLKLPKGREFSIFGSLAQMAMGATDTDAGEFAQLVGEQVAPISPIESNIISPVLGAVNNKTWYGTPIEGQRLEKYAPGQRYDESTDAFSKWLGSVTNWSPKKINYIIDSYTGVIGDFLLPATTPKAEKDPFTKAFVLDTVSTNKISAEFYDKVEDITQRVNSGDKKTAIKAKAENKVIQKYVTQSSELYSLIREAENSDKPDDEKLVIVRDLKATIAALQKQALERLK